MQTIWTNATGIKVGMTRPWPIAAGWLLLLGGLSVACCFNLLWAAVCGWKIGLRTLCLNWCITHFVAFGIALLYLWMSST